MLLSDPLPSCLLPVHSPSTARVIPSNINLNDATFCLSGFNGSDLSIDLGSRPVCLCRTIMSSFPSLLFPLHRQSQNLLCAEFFPASEPLHTPLSRLGALRKVLFLPRPTRTPPSRKAFPQHNVRLALYTNITPSLFYNR